MWAGRDNGRDVSWKGAAKYCRDFRLAGYSNWRLATLAELGAIYDRNANVPGLAGPGKDSLFTYNVKGNLFLTGDEWSSERIKDDRGHPSAYAWYFDFNEGRSDNQPSGFPYPSPSCVRCVCAISKNDVRRCISHKKTGPRGPAKRLRFAPGRIEPLLRLAPDCHIGVRRRKQ